MPTTTDNAKRAEKRRPSAEEIELRKQYRSGLRVERAVNRPGGRPAPSIAPKGAEEQA